MACARSPCSSQAKPSQPSASAVLSGSGEQRQRLLAAANRRAASRPGTDGRARWPRPPSRDLRVAHLGAEAPSPGPAAASAASNSPRSAWFSPTAQYAGPIHHDSAARFEQGDGPPPVLEALPGTARHRVVLGEDVVDAAPRRVVLASLGGRQAELQVMRRLALVRRGRDGRDRAGSDSARRPADRPGHPARPGGEAAGRRGPANAPRGTSEIGLRQRELETAAILLRGRQAIDVSARLLDDPDGLQMRVGGRRPCRRTA